MTLPGFGGEMLANSAGNVIGNCVGDVISEPVKMYAVSQVCVLAEAGGLP